RPYPATKRRGQGVQGTGGACPRPGKVRRIATMPIQLKQLDYVIVYVSDMQRSLAFYRDTLGLTLKFTSPGWTEFVTGATTIALHVVGGGGEKSPTRQSLPPAGQ